MKVNFDRVMPEVAIDALPIRLDQSTSRAELVFKALLLMPAVVALAVPLMLIGAHAVAEPAALDALRRQPMTVVQVGFGIVLWSLLFVLPLRPLISRVGASRVVEVTADRVEVIERGPFRTRVWSAELATYRGVAHHVRSSLSGLRHELVLVHPDSAKHVLLASSSRITSDTLGRTAQVLGLPEIPASALYARAKRPKPVALLTPALAPAGG